MVSKMGVGKETRAILAVPSRHSEVPDTRARNKHDELGEAGW